MSIVVVARKNGEACIASDTLTMFGDQLESAKYHEEADKIIAVGNAFVGSVGDAAHDLVLQSLFASLRQPPAFRDRREIFEFLLKQHPRLKDKYFLQPATGEEHDPYEASHFNLLVASPYGIFGIYILREVYEYTRFAAIGSGERYALGAMFTVYDRYESAADIARAGVEAAVEFNSECGPPLRFHTVKIRAKRGSRRPTAAGSSAKSGRARSTRPRGATPT